MSDETPKPRTQTNPKSLGNLRPATSETAAKLNPKGTNGWDVRRKVLLDFLDGKSADPEKTRIQNVMQATYTNSLAPKGAQDRRLLHEAYFGKALQPVHMSGKVEALRVLAVLPDNGRGPGDPDVDDDGESGPAT